MVVSFQWKFKGKICKHCAGERIFSFLLLKNIKTDFPFSDVFFFSFVWIFNWPRAKKFFPHSTETKMKFLLFLQHQNVYEWIYFLFTNSQLDFFFAIVQRPRESSRLMAIVLKWFRAIIFWLYLIDLNLIALEFNWKIVLRATFWHWICYNYLKRANSDDCDALSDHH